MKRIAHSRVAALLLAAGLWAPRTAIAERVRVPGTGVTLEPPAGFIAADRFPGFQLAERGASIMITEIPGPAAELRKGMTRKVLASRGMDLIASQTVRLRGESALLLHVGQRAGGTDYLKWMVIAGDAKKATMIVGTFPSDASDLSRPIKRAVLSASWSGMASADPFEGLQFRVNSSAELRLADRVGNMLVFSETGKIGAVEPKQAILVVGPSLSQTEIGRLEDFSKERAAKTAQLKDLRNLSGRELELDGLPGYELVAEASDAKTDETFAMYQLVLLEGRTYYIAQGFVESTRAPGFMSAFRRVTSTFRRVSKARPAPSAPSR